MEFVYEIMRIFAMNGENPPVTNKLNGENLIKPPVTNTVTLMMLPNELLLNCLARVSRLYYPTLSLVSKRFRSLLASLELYQTRTLLNRTENCLYVCLWLPDDTIHTRWYTLSRRPVQISGPNHRLFRKNKNKLSENFLVSIPTPKTKFVGTLSIATVGYHIYKFGYKFSRKVSFMDFRSHTWHKAPSMQMARKFPIVTVLDGKIYVMGGNKDCDSSSNWMEFFDPKTQVWKYVQGPDAEICESLIYKSLAIQGKLYLFGRRIMVYKPNENRWDELEEFKYKRLYWEMRSSCVTDNICYGIRHAGAGKLQWYDMEGKGSWRVLKGLKKLPKLPTCYFSLRLVNYGRNIAVLWENEVGEEKEIWCAEISLERCKRKEIRGKIEWCNVMLVVPKSCAIRQFLSVTV